MSRSEDKIIEDFNKALQTPIASLLDDIITYNKKPDENSSGEELAMVVLTEKWRKLETYLSYGLSEKDKKTFFDIVTQCSDDNIATYTLSSSDQLKIEETNLTAAQNENSSTTSLTSTPSSITVSSATVTSDALKIATASTSTASSASTTSSTSVSVTTDQAIFAAATEEPPATDLNSHEDECLPLTNPVLSLLNAFIYHFGIGELADLNKAYLYYKQALDNIKKDKPTTYDTFIRSQIMLHRGHYLRCLSQVLHSLTIESVFEPTVVSNNCIQIILHDEGYPPEDFQDIPKKLAEAALRHYAVAAKLENHEGYYCMTVMTFLGGTYFGLGKTDNNSSMLEFIDHTGMRSLEMKQAEIEHSHFATEKENFQRLNQVSSGLWLIAIFLEKGNPADPLPSELITGKLQIFQHIWCIHNDAPKIPIMYQYQEKAIQKGHAGALVRRAHYFKDNHHRIMAYRIAAGKSNAQGLESLANCYNKGLYGIKRDTTRANCLLRLAKYRQYFPENYSPFLNSDYLTKIAAAETSTTAVEYYTAILINTNLPDVLQKAHADANLVKIIREDFSSIRYFRHSTRYKLMKAIMLGKDYGLPPSNTNSPSILTFLTFGVNLLSQMAKKILPKKVYIIHPSVADPIRAAMAQFNFLTLIPLELAKPQSAERDNKLKTLFQETFQLVSDITNTSFISNQQCSSLGNFCLLEHENLAKSTKTSIPNIKLKAVEFFAPLAASDFSARRMIIEILQNRYPSSDDHEVKNDESEFNRLVKKYLEEFPESTTFSRSIKTQSPQGLDFASLDSSGSLDATDPSGSLDPADSLDPFDSLDRLETKQDAPEILGTKSTNTSTSTTPSSNDGLSSWKQKKQPIPGSAKLVTAFRVQGGLSIDPETNKAPPKATDTEPKQQPSLQ